ncbi:MAG: glycosyltransferase, partial [Planctomycetaceae bacterium]|nr:glycosyltransferase [Planctomycetaceae bacterium]
MKVLHIGKYFPPFFGGMENYLRDLVGAQQRSGLEPLVLVHRHDNSLRSSRETYDDQGTRPLLVIRVAMWFRMLFTPISPTFPLVLNQFLREEGTDLLHLHMPNVSVFWCLLLPRARRRPWVIHWHADVLASTHSIGLRAFYGVYRPFEWMVLKRARAVLVTSPDYLESSKTLEAFRDKCYVVPLGLNPAGMQLVERRDAGSDASLHLLAVGRLTYYKGFEYLLRALADVPEARLTLVGQGELESALLTLS